ncbi:sugar phosphate isomerase/epimerase [Kibdelosporangium philippinense]|uniref:Sugar phosphate isomerase/epimerase n=1 Tax=Kibdelosporangium philippinense TaxID=211113 RepID=A0ABS8Z7L1_9PSEU|nr:sugar phosphate isomerase/epimerase family protein [Kibdelosporangium philippinense]MCE7003054.1 sugar phosphate isomerase/epimerase [Kibdelosporangium philippinense]
MTPLWSVFTKPWAELDPEALGKLVAGLGFNGAEIPVRDNAFVTPGTAEERLPGFAKIMREHGVEIISIAADLSESTFAAAGAAGVPIIRIMAPLGSDDYRTAVSRIRRSLEAAVPFAERYGVGVGIQPHHGRFVTSALGVLNLVEGLPDAFTVVWDAAHDALAGDDPHVTVPLVAHRLSIVNLKNAMYVPADHGWRTWFVQAGEGLSDWSAVFGELDKLAFDGPICLTGQYSDPSVSVEDRLRTDLATAQSLIL